MQTSVLPTQKIKKKEKKRKKLKGKKKETVSN